MADLVQELGDAAMVAVRNRSAGPDFCDAVENAFGLAPPGAGRFTSRDARDLLWIGPGEWLAVDSAGDGPALEAAFFDALAGTNAAVCDVSGNRSRFAIEGENALALMARGCSLDLTSMPEGSCAGTMLARAQILLLRRGPLAFEIMPRRSFAGYLRAWLDEAQARL